MNEQKSMAIELKAWVLPVLFLLMAVADASGQQTKQIEIDNADTFEGDESLGKNVSRLTGNVRFRHQGALMYCDSAYLFQESNSLDAFGKIRIVQGDTLQLTGDFLRYDGNSRIAEVTGNVVMTDRDMVLRAPQLSYQMSTEVADYENGGVITSRDNTLQSDRGYYRSRERMVYFKNAVRLDNPKYFITADTLKYQTVARVAFFEGPTRIFSTGTDSTMIYCEQGWYNTITEKSRFTQSAHIRSKENRLVGDTLYFDNSTMVGTGIGNVQLLDTIQQVIISGDYGVSDDRNKWALVTGNALLTKMFTKDSLFLHADTLRAKQDTVTGDKFWYAFHGVRFFKTDLQGKCDSLVYTSSDSLISLFNEPVLWSDENQLTAQFMNIQVAGSSVTELRLFDDSFIVSQEDTVRFNQIRGRNMTGYVNDNKLSSIRVEGNGQSVYYTRNRKQQITGVNRADCSDMFIKVEESKVQSITLINQPDATFYPPAELQPAELRLKGFSWQETLRPMDRNDIFRR